MMGLVRSKVTRFFKPGCICCENGRVCGNTNLAIACVRIAQRSASAALGFEMVGDHGKLAAGRVDKRLGD